jgi:hypothetical protein
MGSAHRVRPEFGKPPRGKCSLGCADQSLARAFDRTLRAETRFSVSFNDLTLNHVGWYYDADELKDHDFIRELNIKGSGVYLIWDMVDYCEKHEKCIFEAVYVGKAGAEIAPRLLAHFRNATRPLGDGGPMHITIWAGRNRISKYVEQLLLDSFKFPKNKSENRGTAPLRIPTGDTEWD